MTSELPELAQAMLDPSFYPEKPAKVKLMQTQMSFIFIADDYVYKLKKPVNLGYLDYSTLEQRRFFCEQEVSLNRRLSPEVYLGALPVYKTAKGYSLKGRGEVVDYAVKMLYLPQNRMLNVLLDRNKVTVDMLEKLAKKMAEFHNEADSDSKISEFGKLESIRFNTDENFSQTEKYIGPIITRGQFDRIKEYTENMLKDKQSLFNSRVKNNRIKDCHGDLHAAHICFSKGISIYDCIEFNDRFRYCDTASEIAFLAMDLDHYGRADLSRIFINAYAKYSGDLQIKELLKFYKCYRAYVRGKVGCFKSEDPFIGEEERKQNLDATKSYFELADMSARPRPTMFITVGLTGSGKSTMAYALAKRLGITVISSDVIRKQMANIPLTEKHHDEMNTGIYSPEFFDKTYKKMNSDAEDILRQGDSVILDATFIKEEYRQNARKLAEKTGAGFQILECRLDDENTRLRLEKRMQNNSISDGRWEIYIAQKEKYEPVKDSEANNHFVIDTSLLLSKQLEKITTKI